MTTERHELHAPADELPDDQVTAALANVRRQLLCIDGKDWSPESSGIVEGADPPSVLGTNTDDYLAESAAAGTRGLSTAGVEYELRRRSSLRSSDRTVRRACSPPCCSPATS